MGRTRERTRRVVDPWGLVDKDDIWYLIAGTDRGQRTFRVDRIASAVVTDQKAQRPADFDLTAQWQQVVTEMEQLRSAVSATVLIAARLVPVVQSHFGRHCAIHGTEPDGRMKLSVSAHTPVSIAEQLAGWGATVEVIDPPAVRQELARIGRELIQRYQP
jgi:predicted DNA-binding transcriptional regulator YafY